MTALVIMEDDLNQCLLSIQSTITAATLMASTIKVVILGENAAEIAFKIQKIKNVDEIYVLKASVYNNGLAEPCTEAILQLCKGFQFPLTHVVAAANSFGKNVLPRFAAKWGVAQISDIIAVLDAKTYQRPIYAGNAIATVTSQDDLQVVTVRTSAFSPASFSEQLAVITEVDLSIKNNNQSKFISTSSQALDKPKLSSSDIVISGGRGLGNKVNFDRLEAIADQLKAAFGASRAAVDAGLAPNELQVGQTGQIVAPKLYIAVGISGAIQHISGMKDSKIIVAINKDPQAPIFEIADYALIADVEEVLIEWEAYLKTKLPQN